MTNDYGRNILLLYVYSILIKRVSMPIIVLYFLLNNLNYTQIGTLAAVISVISILTEVHGGVFADQKGKKLSLSLHALFGFLTMFFYWIGDSFWHFLVASVMYGIAGAFITGTRNSLLYDTLKELGKTSDFKKYNGRKVLYSHLVNAGVLLVIPIIYEYNAKLPFLIGMGFFLSAMIASAYFKEPSVTERSRKKRTYNTHIKNAVKELWERKKAFSGVLFFTVLLALVYVASDYIQPLLKISGLDVVYFGVVYALMRVLTGAGAAITHRLEKHFSNYSLLAAGVALAAASFAGYAWGFGIVLILAVLVMKFAEGFNRVILEDEINKDIESDNRTTILSMKSISTSSFHALTALGAGVLADWTGVQNTFVYLLAFLIAVILAITFYTRNFRK